MDQSHEQTGAESLLDGLSLSGIQYMFANAGTDFPPIIEALARRDPSAAPVALTIPHETAAVAMAHGAYLVTGRAQAVMVHVNVGLANSVMGVINAASDNIPMLVMSGRTPISERGRKGARMTPIQYGQEMFDQTSLVRDLVKYSYEMRYPEQGKQLVMRAMSLATSEPQGPVYLSLPKEPLSEIVPETTQTHHPMPPSATKILPDPEAIIKLARLLETASNPVIICQRGDTDGRLSRALSTLAAKHGIAVFEPFLLRNVLHSNDPALQGYHASGPSDADLIIVLDSDTPWIEATNAPGPETIVVHIGPDPHFARMPVRGFRTDLAISSDSVEAILAVDRAARAPSAAGQRSKALAQSATQRRDAAQVKAKAGDTNPMSAEWISHCVSEIMDEEAVAFSELGLLPAYMTLKGPNRLFNNVHAGGLGWAMPAALGAQLMRPDRLTIACMGDGSYMFANPVACHQIAEALRLPILTIIKNNAMWNAVRRSVVNGYPDGSAAMSNTVPLTSLEPLPDFAAIARASRAHAERIEDGRELPAALQRAVGIIRTEKRQVLLDLRCAVSDMH
ncbi:thiamine pyrophosphate-requiring protein [Planktomarina temperata]|nr:thiamine pyrophosphate-requiring protein [Planktomarina temperata]MDA7455519.1 thiamine pyrophosphate-requiring protein [Planktomarina temperata]MDA9152624.1 thiamine pyrophosphate-requiring protein [Planktomarina temperata]MDB4006116.1 thiamine pyrophosphate-requiring protein [Planktomarina temperata]MDC0137814.1 thiamine pyrophosphate-requiring protein [Planktomarina temperata]